MSEKTLILRSFVVAATFVMCATAQPSDAGADRRLLEPTAPTHTAGLSPSPHGCPTPATEVRRQLTLRATDGPFDMFNPASAKDVQATYSNRGLTDVELHVLMDGASTPDVLSIPAGTSRTEAFFSVLDVQAVCPMLPTGGADCELDLSLISIPADPADDNSPMQIKNHYIPPCVKDMAVDLPGTPIEFNDCLWELEDLWLSDEPADVLIEMDLTGNQDVTLEVEFADNTFWSYNLFAPPALPNFQWTAVEWEDVIAVRFQCDHSSNACSSCKFNYSVCSN